jgi:sugar phosphate isomerase/epimerase
MTARRTFLKQAGAISAGIMLIKPASLLAAPATTKVGLQLYTLRDYIGKDVKGVIAKVAKAGYKEVETFGYDVSKRQFWGLGPKDFKELLADNGLKSPSGHYGMDQFLAEGKDDDIKAYIEAAHGLGQSTIVIPYLDEKYRKTTEDFKVTAGKFNKIAHMIKAGGLSTGYHNHNFEFVPVDGTMLYDVLLKETDHSLIHFEMDLYWVVRAGQDPIKWIKAHPGRFSMWHIKDMDKAKRELNTEVGAGSIDFKKIFEYKKLAGVKHIFMEQENFSMDAYQSITQSAGYIRNNLVKI